MAAKAAFSVAGCEVLVSEDWVVADAVLRNQSSLLFVGYQRDFR
jgi:hypothetical protein